MLGDRRADSGGEIQQRFGGFRGQVSRNLQQAVLRCIQNFRHPFWRNAVSEQSAFGDVVEDPPLRCFLLSLHVFRNGYFLHALANFNQLCSAGLRMSFKAPALCPLVRFVVVVDVAQQQAGPRAVDNDAKVAADSNGPEVRVFGFVQFVELQSWDAPDSIADRTRPSSPLSDLPRPGEPSCP